MKITIIENEIYLAQSISAKLNRKGYTTELFSSIDVALEESRGDIYLLSTNIASKYTNLFIQKFSDKIILLMVSYHSDVMIRNFLKIGADDYIIKPFHIDELTQKIIHYKEFYNLKTSINTYRSYINYFFRDIGLPENMDMLASPMIIHTNSSIYIDKIIMEYSQKINKPFTFVPLMNEGWKSKIKESSLSAFLYIKNIHFLTKKQREELLKLLTGRKFILSTTTPIESDYKTIELNTKHIHYDGNGIMRIEEYIQFTIKTFQYQFPDTVISKRLGFSRKSLLERRKKYSIYKQKNQTSKG